MPNTSGLAVKVGIFVLIALVLLIGFSLQVTDGFGRNNRYSLNAYFEDALGLQNGADVAVGGVVSGEVSELSFNSNRRRVHVVIELGEGVKVPTDSVAVIEKNALLGNAVISIKYGEATDYLPEGGEIQTRRMADLNEVMAKISDAADEARNMMADFRSDQEGVFGKLEAVIEENREDIRRTTQSLADAGPKLEMLADDLTSMTADLRAGKGTMGRLFSDDQLYNDLKDFTAEAKKITADIRETSGTLSRLIYDDTLIRQAETSLAKVSDAGERINNLLSGREEDLDKFFDSVSDIGPKLDAALTDLNEVAAKVNEGEGTLGQLVNDPTLYQDTKRAVNQVAESFEEGEEQGVIRSFVGVLFGALL